MFTHLPHQQILSLKVSPVLGPSRIVPQLKLGLVSMGWGLKSIFLGTSNSAEMFGDFVKLEAKSKVGEPIPMKDLLEILERKNRCGFVWKWSTPAKSLQFLCVKWWSSNKCWDFLTIFRQNHHTNLFFFGCSNLQSLGSVSLSKWRYFIRWFIAVWGDWSSPARGIKWKSPRISLIGFALSKHCTPQCVVFRNSWPEILCNKRARSPYPWLGISA